jgi:tetratricopeptide (TPR) repeat protein
VRPSLSGPRAKLAAAILTAAVAVVVYLPGLPGEFVYDDGRLIVQNDGLKRPFDPRRALLRDYYASDFDRMGLGYYRPVAVLSVELDYRRGGGAALPFHLSNAAVHAGASLLVLALGLVLFEGAVGASAAGALLFALHPAHSESVAFISGRVDPLMALFGLAAIVLHLRGARSARPWRWRAGAGLAWLLALLSKEMAASVPLLVLLLEIAREGWPRRDGLGGRAARYVPYLGASAVYAAMRLAGLGRLLGAADTSTAPSILRPFVVLGSYLAWLVVPPWGFHLEPPPVEGAKAALAVLALAGALAGAVLLWRAGRRLEGALAGWCLVSLLPVAQLWPIETTLSERFLYLPSAGVTLLLAALLLRGDKRMRRAAGAAALALLGAYYAGLLLHRVPLWRNELALWTAKAAEEPTSLKAQLNLAHVYLRLGCRDESLASFERAKTLDIDPALVDAEMASLLGGGTLEERIETLRRSVAHTPRDGALRSNLGFLLLQQGDIAAAGEAFEKAVEVSSARAEAWLGLAMVGLRSNRIEAAGEAARRAAELDPDLGIAKAIRAECELRLGRPCEALRLAENVVLDDPSERAALERIRASASAACQPAR